MSRVNVYLPDDLAERARAAELNVSALARSAIEDALDQRSLSGWLERYRPGGRRARHVDAMSALDQTREEFGSGPTSELR
ncbi:type II toxin-antitoxin system CcdA family antitoxin [Microlunatus soli]|uniref:Post-segregation antitoxin (Ccd killing mechanism protein) encoded by the F plasmid n=1 Tax=Microlunatus soli TaxID=630515 RepID=A0A1H1ZYG6_9ACTN|nr:type II toxin-antitoxin system CcdA family antitoxin [Microlunatus soli]SDT38720.1 Post-segregation antitoxin (ccd killing mechanism protein) encoded by the F plasmid [Microlunatus soli]